MAISTILTFTLTSGFWVLDEGQPDYQTKRGLMSRFGNVGRKVAIDNTAFVTEQFELNHPHLTLQFGGTVVQPTVVVIGNTDTGETYRWVTDATGLKLQSTEDGVNWYDMQSWAHNIPALQIPEGGAVGTGTISSTGTAITGVGTLFTTELEVGGPIVTATQSMVVQSITDDFNIVVEVAPTVDILAGTAYAFGAAPTAVTTGGFITLSGFAAANSIHSKMSQISGANPHIETGAIRVGTATSGGTAYEGYNWGADGGSAVLWNQTNTRWECWTNTGTVSQIEAGSAMGGVFSHIIATGSIVTENGNSGPDPATAAVGTIVYETP